MSLLYGNLITYSTRDLMMHVHCTLHTNTPQFAPRQRRFARIFTSNSDENMYTK